MMHDCSRFNESKKDTLNIFHVRDREKVVGSKKKTTSSLLVTTAYSSSTHISFYLTQDTSASTSFFVLYTYFDDRIDER